MESLKDCKELTDEFRKISLESSKKKYEEDVASKKIEEFKMLPYQRPIKIDCTWNPNTDSAHQATAAEMRGKRSKKSGKSKYD